MAIYAYCYIKYFVYIAEKKEEDLFNQNRLTSLIDMDGSTTIHVHPGRSASMITGIEGLFIFQLLCKCTAYYNVHLLVWLNLPSTLLG